MCIHIGVARSRLDSRPPVGLESERGGCVVGESTGATVGRHGCLLNWLFLRSVGGDGGEDERGDEELCLDR